MQPIMTNINNIIKNKQKMILPILAIISLSTLLAPTHSDKQAQTKYLLSQNFQGNWYLLEAANTTNIDPWAQIQGKQGIGLVGFQREGEREEDMVLSVWVELLMPRYRNQKVLSILFDLPNYYKTDGSLKTETEVWVGHVNSTYFLYNETKQVLSGVATVQFNLDSSLLGLKIDQQSTIIITFAPKYLSPRTSFSFSFFAFIIFLALRRKHKVSDTRITHQPIPLILSTVLTFLVSVCQILIGVSSLFGKMSPEAFFTIAGIINLGICYQVARFYWPIVFGCRWSIVMVWGVACGYLWFLLFFRHNYVCLIINSLVFLPEIGYHCLRGKKIQSDLRYILFVFSNQIYVMYYKSCPANIFKQSPIYLVAYCVSSLLIAQTVILLGQLYFGSRFFIPSFLQPTYHNYYNPESLKLATRGPIECHICLEEVKKEEVNKKRVMVTPCAHIFHVECLEKWMLVQMRCPVDRSVLPPI